MQQNEYSYHGAESANMGRENYESLGQISTQRVKKLYYGQMDVRKISAHSGKV